MPRIFALLTGIKDYHPQSGVSGLSGCVNDVNNMEAMLVKKFGAANVAVKKLLNEQATREAFRDSFVSHLINNPAIQPDDTVLFYYSGHGSFSKSNAAFSTWDSEGRDETLVLYDSRCAGGFDLADKELRLLLSRIRATSIIVIVDACHSGSITRNINDLDVILLGKAKHAPARSNDAGRNLADYFTVNNEGYEQLLDENNKARLPELRCITLSACDRTEVAYESSYSPEGMFTSMMLEALNAGVVNLSYSQLYEQLYTLLKRRARQQTPQLQVSGNFNVNTVVFENTVAAGNGIYQVVKENGKVTINCGALHGMKNDRQSVKSMAVSITDKDDPAAAPRLAKITAVGLDNAELENITLTPKIYQGTLLNLPPAVCIYVNADAATQQAWQQLAEKEKEETLAFVYSKDQYHDYELKVHANRVSLTEPATGKVIKQTDNASPQALVYILACCNKINDWHLLQALHNYAMPEDSLSQVFNTEMNIELFNREKQEWELQKGNELVVYLDEQNNDIPINMHLTTGPGTGWYCGVYYLNSRFGIEVCTNPVNESKLTSNEPMNPLEGASITMDDGVDEMTDYLKLVIGREPFKDFLINEFDGFEKSNNEYGLGKKKSLRRAVKIDQSWFVKTIAIRIVRRSGAIDSDTSFNLGKLTMHQNNALNGRASVSSITAHAKSVHPAEQLRQFVAENGYELVNLETTRSANGASVVWVDKLQGDVSKQEPLMITLAEIPADDQGIAAITMEDGVIQLIGFGSPDKEAGNYSFEIPVLPEDQQRKKNLVRAAWFCFVKVVLKKDLSMLRKVIYENGRVDYKNISGTVVNPGMKVAVCIHGIIGNTKGMAASMEFLQAERQYDLILAFDYENLNAKIEDIALTFKTMLANAGVSSTTPVDIISHSMGGLISRYMIEHIKGTEGWVNRLFMFGTPNAGSVLGSIPKIRDWTVTVLTLACNFGGAALGAVGPVLSAAGKALGATKVATNSLAQMAIDSSFYDELNNKPDVNTVTTKYHIIAGNVLEFKPAEDSGRFEKVMEKIKRQVGEMLYSADTKNDIAVGVDSILTLPQGISVTKQTFPGHHMNYFDLAAPMNYFKTLV
ncbi:caspase family protein [Niastella populi]|uniref:Uncharacterized protein n=1 Tax=Niastella populi TaxID=550983 RepID=A0A1V9FKV2_9BACT|nr:caspase family protein [Niastella populi]OQP59013.1 hypothetical protein A4R26_21730 [Niastella populi]